MDSTALVVVIVVVALGFDFTNGFHDSANAIATSISTKALTPRVALVMAAAANVVGALISTAVATTIGSGIISPPQHQAGLVLVVRRGDDRENVEDERKFREGKSPSHDTFVRWTHRGKLGSALRFPRGNGGRRAARSSLALAASRGGRPRTARQSRIHRSLELHSTPFSGSAGKRDGDLV